MRQYIWYSPQYNIFVLQTIVEGCMIAFEWNCELCGNRRQTGDDHHCEMTEQKAREVYVEFGGNPSDDKEIYKRYTATRPFKPGDMNCEVIHYVEYSALQTANAKLERAKSALKECIHQLEWHNQPEPAASTNVVLTRAIHILADLERE
jgi:hypothetical protein